MSLKCIGIDIGGTSVKLGIFEEDGTLVKKWEIPTRKEENGKYILGDIAGINVRMIDQGSSELSIIVGVDDKDFESTIRAIYHEFVK